jgi:hypothetical protein
VGAGLIMGQNGRWAGGGSLAPWRVAIGGAGCLGPLSGLPPFLVSGRAGPRAWGSAQARFEPRVGPARARVSSSRAEFVSGFFLCFVSCRRASCCMAKYIWMAPFYFTFSFSLSLTPNFKSF